MSIREAATALRSGGLTSRDLTAQLLRRADAVDPELGVYVTRFDTAALARAEEADRELSEGRDLGPLHGIPLGVKDIIACADGPTTAQSLVLDPEWGRGRDASVVSALRRAGAVFVGKTTTMEFACGMPDEHQPFPVPRNPWDRTRWTGGSSSGTANGVVAGLFLGGLGTDTGGSIRVPSALCGATGLKPTYGRVSTDGVVPLAHTLDTVGPIGRSADDCALLLATIDPTGLDELFGRPPYAAPGHPSVRGLRIGVDRRHHFGDDTDTEVVEAFASMLTVVTEMGATVVDVELPYFDEVRTAVSVVLHAEASAYHLRDLRSRWAEYGAPTRISLAQGVLLSAADYVQAQRVRRAAQLALVPLFADVDLIVTPTVGVVAPSWAEYASGGVDAMLDFFRSIYTFYWNGTGHPALAMPIGFSGEGLPLSVQAAGRPFADEQVLGFGGAYQQVTDWHRRVPGGASGQLTGVGH